MAHLERELTFRDQLSARCLENGPRLKSRISYWKWRNSSQLCWFIRGYPPGNNISQPPKHFWVDDVPFPKVGYVSSLEGTYSSHLLREFFFLTNQWTQWTPVVDEKNLLVSILCSKNDDQKWQENSLLVWEGQVKLRHDSLHELFIDKSVVNYLPSIFFRAKTPEIRWLEDEFRCRIACSSAVFKECTV